MRRFALAALPVAVLALTACPPPGPASLSDAAYPGVLRSPAGFPGSYVARQQVAGAFGEERYGYEAVLQKRGDTLMVLGLAPYGGKAFAVTQTGEAVTSQSFVPVEVPIPPRFMLLDVHRAFLVGLPGAPLTDGEHRGTLDGEEIVETWQGGRLLRRTFRRLDGLPPGLIDVAYAPGLAADGLPPRLTTLLNGWFGYRLEITTVTCEVIE